MKRYTPLALGSAVLVGVPGVLLLAASPAQADAEKAERCHQAVVELSVDRERGGFEVDGDIDGAKPGSRWQVVLRHDGRIVADTVRRADAEGEIDLDRFRPDTANQDVFRLKVRPVMATQSCSVSVTVA